MPGHAGPGETVLLDVRSELDFVTGHAPAAASLPLEALETRTHELPPPAVCALVFDDDDARAEAALEALRRREHRCRAATPAEVGARAAWVPGPPRVRAWRPHGLVERAAGLWWDARRRLDPAALDAAPRPRALDLGCGSGRDAVWLARAGFGVDALDHLPDALERVRDLAFRNGVAVAMELRDLETEAPTLPADAYDLVVCCYFLWRPLWAPMAAAVRPGGLVVVETFAAAERARSGFPRRERFVLQPGELRAAFAGLEVLAEEVGENAAGRLVERFVARRAA